jgi:Flp pilus assembly protein TadD
VLALIYRFVGTSVLTVRLFQAVVSAFSCALLAGAGRYLFSPRAGLVAGLMLAAYPPAIFLDTILQKSALDVFFLCLALWLVSRLSSEQRRWTWFELGLAIGCLSLTRENAMILVIPIAMWTVLQRVPSARLVSAVLFAAGLATVLAPVAIRNATVGHEFFLTTSQFGPNLYIGNNERSDGAYKPLRPFREQAAFEREDATELAEEAVGRHLTPAEVSSYYTTQVVHFIRTEPGAWVKLLARKFALTWNAVEIADTEDQYTYARWSWPLAIGAVWNLGLLVPLAALGVWSTAADWRRTWVLYAMLAAYVSTVVLFYVFARYRFPIVPVLTLFAGAGVTRAGAEVRRHRWRPLAGCAVAMCALGVFCHLPLVDTATLEAATRFNDGVGLEAASRDDDALAEYQAAAHMNPDFAAAHNNLGLLLARHGRIAEATLELREAVRLSPALVRAQNNLAVMLSQEGQLPEALEHLRAAVRFNPKYDEARLNLVSVLVQSNRDDEAVAALPRALTPGESDPHLLGRLAGALAARGRLDGAETALRLAVQAAPTDAMLHNNLGTVLAERGNAHAASAEFARAAALDPVDLRIRRNLERLRHPR